MSEENSKTMSKPYVSVLIDTYNHERFIEQAITSVLEQDRSMADVEIVVVDDGSTDGTPEIVRRFEPRVRLLQKPNGGQASAFNTGIPECGGEIIAFLDGDDWWAKGKLRRVVKVMSANPLVGLVGHGIVESFGEGVERIQAPEKEERMRLDSLAAARVFRLRRSYLGTSRMTLRANVARQILPVPEALVIEADEYLFTLAAALSDMILVQEPLSHYRIHPGNLYLSAARSRDSLKRKQRVMAALAEVLNQRLRAFGVPAEAVECIVEIVQADADQMRLMLDGGAPWETVRVEQKIYEAHHADAPLTHRIFRTATMIPALLLPPRWFYRGRRWLASRNWYLSARKRVLPVPRIAGVARPKEFKV